MGRYASCRACKTTAGRDGWLAFFRDLTARGLTGVRLVTSDAHRGLVEAIGATLPAPPGSDAAPITRRT
jgi:transposase-like protein